MIVVSTIKGGYLAYFFNVYGIILSNVILRSTLMSEFVDFGGFARISKIGADNNIVKKELKFDYINNTQAKARLKREIESLRLFDSNRIVKLLDYDSENYSWYTMPFYKSNLETFCNNIEIEENLIINIAKNILEAMSVIESQNMVHRDLKPNNILLNSIEDLVICDFGLTKMQRDTVLTRSLQGMGTDYYSAPEQLENAKNVDIRADIFSFGRILIWLFTKNRTYDINHNLIPMKFRSLIKKCVELNPEQRYKSVRELTSAFEQRISKDNLFNRKQILDQITVDSESYINFLSISDLELNRYSEEEFYKIIDGDYDFLLKSPYPLCQEFYYECVSNMLRPRTIVDYEREPWVYDFGTVRLTFDQNVRVAVGSFDIFDPDLPTIPVIDPEKMVFEVKYTEYLPKIVQSVLPGKADMMAVSKYVLAYEKSQYLNGFEYWEDGNI